jgi:hypothetical protein
MSRSASRRPLEPLVEFLVLMLLTLRFTLDRLFADLKLRDLGVKGARIVDRVEFRAPRNAGEETPNIGYTGSTGPGELRLISSVPVRAGLDGSRGPSRSGGLGAALRRLCIASPNRPVNLRRWWRIKRMPRTRVMRITRVEETEIAMTAALMKTNQPGKTRYRKRWQTWIISGNRLVLLRWVVQN